MIITNTEVGRDMTKEGFRSVLVSEETYEKLKQISKKKNLSMCKTVGKIVEEYINQHQAEAQND